MNDAIEQQRREAGVDWDAIAHVLAIAAAGAPRRLEPGVYKHRTVAEWNAQSALWEVASVEHARQQTTSAPNK